MTALQDEDAQERGFVFLMYHVGRATFNRDLNLLRKRTNLHAALPIRIVAAHVCMDDTLLRPYVAFACFVIRTKNRLRMRVHFGEFLLVHI
jgi:hypothetical protein